MRVKFSDVTTEDKQKIIDAYSRGIGSTRITQETGFSAKIMRKVIDDAHIPRMVKGCYVTELITLTEQETRVIIDLYNSGKSVDTIVKLQSYGERIVYRTLRKSGIIISKIGRYMKYRPTNPENKVCTRCERELPKNEFSNQSKGSRLRAYCKSCSTEVTKIRNLKQLGLTFEDYKNMVERQQGLCACCGQLETYNIGGGNLETKSLAVDHNHKTGKVRELLCNRCNVVLGL
jgi:hypothetical protein